MNRQILGGIAAIALTVALPSAASALTFTNTVGGSTTGSGPYTLTSTDATYSVLRFINNEAVNFGDLTNLDLTYDAVQGGIGGGAPRIAVVLDFDHDGFADGSFDILLGPAGSFVDGALGVHNTGNLLAMNDIGRYDLGGIGGGFYSDYAHALAMAGGYGVLRFSVILDSFGGADKIFVIGKDGLNAGGAVPEPGTWALMIGGFGLMGAVLRRRRATLA